LTLRFNWQGDPAIRILGPRVLVQRLPLPETVASGLYLLGREYPTLAMVIRLGSGERRGYKRGLPYFKGKHPMTGYRWPITSTLYDIRVFDRVQFPSGEFQKWEIAPDWAIMPIDSLELAMRCGHPSDIRCLECTPPGKLP